MDQTPWMRVESFSSLIHSHSQSHITHHLSSAEFILRFPHEKHYEITVDVFILVYLVVNFAISLNFLIFLPQDASIRPPLSHHCSQAASRISFCIPAPPFPRLTLLKVTHHTTLPLPQSTSPIQWQSQDICQFSTKEAKAADLRFISVCYSSTNQPDYWNPAATGSIDWHESDRPSCLVTPSCLRPPPQPPLPNPCFTLPLPIANNSLNMGVSTPHPPMHTHHSPPLLIDAVVRLVCSFPLWRSSGHHHKPWQSGTISTTWPECSLIHPSTRMWSTRETTTNHISLAGMNHDTKETKDIQLKLQYMFSTAWYYGLRSLLQTLKL